MIPLRIVLAGALAVSASPGSSLTDGLVAYYKEDTQGSHADSAGANGGAAIGAVTFTPNGKLGGAYTYPGNNSGDDPRVKSILPGVQGWTGGTISAWVKPLVYASNNNLTIAQVREAANWGHFWLYVQPFTRKVVFHVGTGQGSSADATSSVSIADNTWYHVVATWDKTANAARVFVNGAPDGTTNVPNWGQATDEFYWGAGFNGYGTNGAIDEIGVWNRPLTPQEVASLHNGGHGVTYPFPNPAISFFDGFGPGSVGAGGNWLADGDCSTPKNPGQTVFCSSPEFVDLSAPGQVSLRGRVENGVRKGSALNWSRPLLPLTGTFAARVAFRGPMEDGVNGNASIKAFFTYRSAGSDPPNLFPCQHVEQDFEILTGASRLYSRQNWVETPGWGRTISLWPVLQLLWPAAGQIVTSVTHNSNLSNAARQACPEDVQIFDMRNFPWDTPTLRSFPRNFSLKHGLRGLAGPDGYLSLVLTVQCEAPCLGPRNWYISTYHVGANGANYLKLGATRTSHDVSQIQNAAPLFNLWWLDPSGSADPGAIKRSSAPQSMDIKWFYWHQDVRDFRTAHDRGEQCDAGIVSGENACN